MEPHGNRNGLEGGPFSLFPSPDSVYSGANVRSDAQHARHGQAQALPYGFDSSPPPGYPMFPVTRPPGPPLGPPLGPPPMSERVRLFIGNIPWAWDGGRLAHAFAPFGPVVDAEVSNSMSPRLHLMYSPSATPPAQIVIDRLSGRSKGFGFVTFSSSAAVQRITQSGPLEFDGRVLLIGEATPRTAGSGGSGGVVYAHADAMPLPPAWAPSGGGSPPIAFFHPGAIPPGVAPAPPQRSPPMVAPPQLRYHAPGSASLAGAAPAPPKVPLNPQKQQQEGAGVGGGDPDGDSWWPRAGEAVAVGAQRPDAPPGDDVSGWDKTAAGGPPGVRRSVEGATAPPGQAALGLRLPGDSAGAATPPGQAAATSSAGDWGLGAQSHASADPSLPGGGYHAPVPAPTPQSWGQLLPSRAVGSSTPSFAADPPVPASAVGADDGSLLLPFNALSLGALPPGMRGAEEGAKYGYPIGYPDFDPAPADAGGHSLFPLPGEQNAYAGHMYGGHYPGPTGGGAPPPPSSAYYAGGAAAMQAVPRQAHHSQMTAQHAAHQAWHHGGGGYAGHAPGVYAPQPPHGPPQPPARGVRVFVGNLPFALDSRRLGAAFSHLGRIVDAEVSRGASALPFAFPRCLHMHTLYPPRQVVTDRATGRSKGYGFVTFESEADARRVLEDPRVLELDGRVVLIGSAKARGAGPAGPRVG